MHSRRSKTWIVCGFDYLLGFVVAQGQKYKSILGEVNSQESLAGSFLFDIHFVLMPFKKGYEHKHTV